MRRAMSINEFTEAYGISRATFYRHLKAGEGPQIMRLGRRILIPVDAAREWENAHIRSSVAPR